MYLSKKTVIVPEISTILIAHEIHVIHSSLPDRERDPLEKAQWNLGFLTKGENSVCSTRRNKSGWRAPHRPLHQCARCPTAPARPECVGTPMNSQRTVQRLCIIRKSDKNVSFKINLIGKVIKGLVEYNTFCEVVTSERAYQSNT